MKIPKYIHFIWAGGKKLMPKENRSTVAEWSAKNKNFTTYLWVYSETTPNLDEFKGCSAFKDTSIKFKDIKELTKLIEKIEDIKVKKLCQQIYNIIIYELKKAITNYGMTSDLLRYLILFLMGGAYFDSDINSKESLDQGKFFEERDNPVVYFTYGQEIGCKFIGNDGVFSTQKHPFWPKLFQLCLFDYQNNLHINPDNYGYGTLCFSQKDIEKDNFEQYFSEGHANELPILRTKAFHGLSRREDRKHIKCETICVTGPEQLRKAKYLFENKDLLEILDQTVTQEYFFPYVFNTRLWLNLKPKTVDNQKEALALVKNSIYFEAYTLGILQFDIHIEDVKKILKESEIEVDEKIIFDEILKIISSSDFKKNIKNINSVNMITKYKEFYQYIINNFSALPSNPKVITDEIMIHFKEKEAQTAMINYLTEINRYYFDYINKNVKNFPLEYSLADIISILDLLNSVKNNARLESKVLNSIRKRIKILEKTSGDNQKVWDNFWKDCSDKKYNLKKEEMDSMQFDLSRLFSFLNCCKTEIEKENQEKQYLLKN